MTTRPETPTNHSSPPPAAAALGFVLGITLLGFVAMLGGAVLA